MRIYDISPNSSNSLRNTFDICFCHSSRSGFQKNAGLLKDSILQILAFIDIIKTVSGWDLKICMHIQINILFYFKNSKYKGNFSRICRYMS